MWLLTLIQINLFTACNISWLKGAQTHLQTVYFQSYNTSPFNAICVLMKIFSHASAKKKTEGRRVSNFELLLVVLK